MNKLFLLLLITVFCDCGTTYAQTPNWLWAESSTGGAYEYGMGLVVDTSGDSLFVGGRLSGTSTLGGITVTASTDNPIIGKFDSAGRAVWLHVNNYSGGYDYMFSICRDNSNNIYGTGTVNSGNGTFVEKYNSSGILQWNPAPNGPGASGIAADNSGNVYVFGSFTVGNAVFSTLTFGNVVTGTVTNPGSGVGLYIVKLDKNGYYIWGKTIAGTGSNYGGDIITDNLGNLYLMGSYTGTDVFDTITSPASSGISNIYIAKYDTSGNVKWVTTASDAGISGPWEETRGIAIDPCGNLYVTGMFENTAKFGSSLSVTSSGDEDMFVAKCLSNGKWEWVNSAGGLGRDGGYSIALDKNYDVYVGGSYGDVTGGTGINFGSGISYTSSGNFIAKYASGSGQVLWAQVGAVSSMCGVGGMDVDKWGYVYITGAYSNAITFGTSQITSTAPGNIYIAKLDTSPSTKISPIVITGTYCPGSTITIPYTVTGSFNSGNSFTAQLSDSTGSFINDTTIGSVDSIKSGTITVTIPTNTPVGSNYLIRIVSSNPANCSYVGCLGFTVGNTLNVSVIPPDTSICAGGSVQLSASGGTTYLWSNRDISSSITVNPATDTTYELIISNGTCSKDTFISVKIIPAPALIIKPQDTTICNGSSVTLFAPSTGSGYSWLPAATLSSAAADSVIATPTVQTTYTVNGTDSVGCAATGTDIVYVNVGFNKPIITDTTDNLFISTATQGNQWYKNGAAISGATGESYTATDTGCYYDIATNIANGCSSISNTLCIDTLTGINQLSVISNQLSVYPNPTGGEIFVNINSSVADVKDWNLQITDVLGRTVYSKLSLNYNNSIDLSDLPGGVYFIIVVDESRRAVFPIVRLN